MGMHFKLGLYEHQSAGALEGIQKMIFDSKFTANRKITDIENINIVAYEPAFGIIGDPAKKTPSTRQSADHSMVYIVSTMLRKAFEDKEFNARLSSTTNLDEIWKNLMLEPKDYGHKALFDSQTRNLMTKCTFTHGGPSYDSKYPEGIPTSISITFKDGVKVESGFVMFPSGHSRNTSANLKDILNYKNNLLGRLSLGESELKEKLSMLNSIESLTNQDLQKIYECKINVRKFSVDEEQFTE
jgi:2-methylcitrate dehydratase